MGPMANTGRRAGVALLVAAVLFGCTFNARAQRDKPDKDGPRTRYVGPGGSDGGDCTADAPCRTLDFDRLKVKPGDTVVVKDGTYGGLRIVCGSENPALSGGRCNGRNANARCGTADAPITVRAENERKTRLKVDGMQSAIYVEGCQYLVVQGFDTATADSIAATKVSVPTIADFRNSHVTFRRILGWGTNRCGNNHVFQTVGSTDSVFEENEAWNHSRHAFSCSGGDRVVYRRNYINNNDVTQSGNPACLENGKPRGGTSRESIALYPCSNSIIENNMIEGKQAWGINVEGAAWSLKGQRPSSNNKVIGNVVAGTYLGMKVFTRDKVTEGIADNVVRHFLALGQSGSFGIRDSVSIDTVYDHVTVYGVGGKSAGMMVDDPCTWPPCHAQLACSELTKGPASMTVSDSVFCDNDGTQLDVVACNGASARRCTLRNVRASGGTPFARLAAACEGGGDDQCQCSGITTTPCKGLGTKGTECVAYWPEGGGLGADIRCKTENAATLHGPANGLWAQPGDTPAPTTTCSGTTPEGPVTPCLGGFRFCGAVVAGKNDQAENCRTYAERRLNQRADGKGCPVSTMTCP
jgi:hypothetical protein